MNDCQPELLSRYLDGELDPAARTEVDAHLASCADCREELARLGALDSLAAETFPELASPGQLPPARKPRSALKALLAASVALALLGGSVWGAYRAMSGPAIQGSPEDDAVTRSQSLDSARDEWNGDPDSSAVDGKASSSGRAGSGADGVSADDLGIATAGSGAEIVQGVVTDFHGNPLAGARIQAWWWNARASMHNVSGIETALLGSTDESGAFRIALPEQAASLRFIHHGYLHRDASWLRESGIPPVDRLRVRLFRDFGATSVEGRVVDPFGAPVAGARIAPADDMTRPPVAISDSSGQWHWEGDWPQSGRYAPHLQVRHPDFAVELVPVSLGESESGRSVALSRGATLEVRVTRNGRPESGAHVEIRDAVYNLREFGVTGNDGSTKFSSLIAATYYIVEARGETGLTGQQPGQRVLVHANIPNLLEIPLAASGAARVSGRVTWSDGSPQAQVQLYLSGEDETTRVWALTDADGRYSVELPPGEYSVHPFTNLRDSKVLSPWRRTVVCSPGTEHEGIDFELARSEMKLDDFREIVPGLPELDGPLIPQLHLRPGTDFLVTASGLGVPLPQDNSDRLSLFEIDSGRGFVLDRAEDGSYEAHEVQLGTITGEVVDTNGNPVDGVQVVAYEHRVARGTTFYLGMDETDASGEFELGPLMQEASYRLRVSRPGYVAMDNSVYLSVPDSRRITMARTDARLEGIVIDTNGSPVAHAQVRGGPMPGSGLVTTTDSRGRFSLRTVAGENRLAANFADRYSPTSILYAPSSDNVLEIPGEFSTVEQVIESVQSASRSRNLKQLGLSFKMYAGEHRGAYPARAPEAGNFMFDLSQMYPDYVSDPAAWSGSYGDFQLSFCYPGYILLDDADGAAYLDIYESYGPGMLAGEAVEFDTTDGGGGLLIPMGEGRDALSAYLESRGEETSSPVYSRIPAMWEMPDEAAGNEAHVLYLDGHVEVVPYPGKFPMTEQFIERLRALMG